mgnify:CR=1 FL=1
MQIKVLELLWRFTEEIYLGWKERLASSFEAIKKKFHEILNLKQKLYIG